MSKKILPINSKSNITLYTHHSLPLLIPFVNDNTIGWYMNNFINISYRHQVPSFFDYCDYKRFYQDVLDVDHFTYETAMNFNKFSFFVKCIDNSQYIYAWVDQYYISSNVNYHVNHDIHPVLIYGYNSESREYYCKCFSVLNSVYDAVVPVKEFHKSLKKAAQVNSHINDDDVFCLYKITDTKVHNFSIDGFYSELFNYCFGYGKHTSGAYFSNSDWFYNFFDYDMSSYGIEVTNIFANGFDRQIEHFEYRLLHMIWENKHCILERLSYIEKLFTNIIDGYKITQEYNDLVNKWDNLRYILMKNSLSINDNFYNLSFPENIATKFKYKVLELYKLEKSILLNVLYKLSNVCVKNYFINSKLLKTVKEKDMFSVSSENRQKARGVVIFNPFKRTKGTLIINDKPIEIDEVRTQNFIFYPIDEIINTCVFIPQNLVEGIDLLQMYIVYEITPQCRYIPSSTYVVDRCNISADYLGDLTESFWCADVDDSEPTVELIFNNPIKSNTLLLIQHEVEHRIGGIKINAYLNNSWCTLYTNDNISSNQQIIFIQYDSVVAERYTIVVTKKHMDSNGFDIPNILYLKIFDDFSI